MKKEIADELKVEDETKDSYRSPNNLLDEMALTDDEVSEASKEPDVELVSEEEESSNEEESVEEESAEESEEETEEDSDDTEEKSQEKKVEDGELTVENIPPEWEWEDFSKNIHRLPPAFKNVFKKMSAETGKKMEYAAELRKDLESRLKSLEDKENKIFDMVTQRQNQEQDIKVREELENMTEEERLVYNLSKKMEAIEKKNLELEKKLQNKEITDANTRLESDINRIIEGEIPEKFRESVRENIGFELMKRWQEDINAKRPQTSISVVAKELLEKVKPKPKVIEDLILNSDLPEYVELRKKIMRQGAEKVISKKKTKQIPATTKSGVEPTKKDVLPETVTLDDFGDFLDKDPEVEKLIKNAERDLNN